MSAAKAKQVLAMNTNRPSLELVQIASPCEANWSEMEGDERVRFCRQCKLHVYNLSEMERGEAEAFMADRTGRTCVRMYRRQDGTVLTKDCPVGLRGVRQRILSAVAAIAALVAALVSGTVLGAFRNRTAGKSGPTSAFARWIDPNYDVITFTGVWLSPTPPTTVVMGGCPAPPAGLIPMPTGIVATSPDALPPAPTREQGE